MSRHSENELERGQVAVMQGTQEAFDLCIRFMIREIRGTKNFTNFKHYIETKWFVPGMVATPYIRCMEKLLEMSSWLPDEEGGIPPVIPASERCKIFVEAFPSLRVNWFYVAGLGLHRRRRR